MYKLTDVDISGLWGTRNVHLRLREDVNFLIGRNGTGKTTVVNLIASILNTDWAGALEIPFERAEVGLYDAATDTTGLISVERAGDSGPIEPPLLCRLRIGGCVDEYRVPESVWNLYHPGKTEHSDLAARLRELVNVQWLPVGRAKLGQGTDRKSFETTVDLKLAQLAPELSRYFSQISSLRWREHFKFQEQVFLSLIAEPKFDAAADSLLQIDFANAREVLSDVVADSLWLEPSQFQGRLEHLFTLVQEATEKHKTGQTMSANEIGAVFAVSRLTSLKGNWTVSKTRIEEISRPQADFVNALNELFGGKVITVDSANELSVRSPDKLPLATKQLSSGEKQMVIMLGEALLEKRAKSVYIADEPEISLHIEWQEHLVEYLRKLNPNAQLILATHSPDILGAFTENVIDMTKT